MIGVQSFPELYTALIGWQLYDQLWTLLSQTGLAFLPFIGMMLKNITEPYGSQEPKDAAATSLRRMEIDSLSMLLLIFLGVSPLMPLNPSLLSYSPVCQAENGQDKKTYAAGDTQTTWDKAFTVPAQDVRVPLWWYAVLSVSEGAASSANTLLRCVPDLRKMVTQVDMTQLTDPALKQELQQFEANCYLPARTQYLQDAHNPTDAYNAVNQARKKYGSEDSEWLGSQAFQQTYYQQLRAEQPVEGFPYRAQDDLNAEFHQKNPEAFGTPLCAEWWNQPAHGLKDKLYAALPKTFSDELKALTFGSEAPIKDRVVKRLIVNADTGYQKAGSLIGDFSYSHAAVGIGTFFSQLSVYPKLYAALQAAPMIQALLLLMVYAFLPFALVFAGYKPSAFITGGIIIFSIVFWSFIWHLVSYVDAALMKALYAGSWFQEQTMQATLADMITGTLIIVAPLFWFSFMGSMGVAVGDVVSKAFTNMNNVGEAAAKEGAGLTKSVFNNATGKIKKKFSGSQK